MAEISYRRHRFPPVVIQHAVWLYASRSANRDVEELLAERGLDIVKDAICFRNTSGRSSPRRRRTRLSRSHARWAGRAAARPQSKLRCAGGERATFGSGGARKYGCDQTGCGGLSVVEQPASLIGALNS